MADADPRLTAPRHVLAAVHADDVAASSSAPPGWESATSAAATSGGVVSRPAGCIFWTRSIISSLPGIFRSAGVSVTPARSAFTAILRGASSTASCRTWDSSADLAAETAP